jgi:prepilin-type N-terminal cleavage/methylation domain-containing protein
MTARAAHHRSRTSGNTLVELLVVLAILALIASVTGLAFRTPRDTRVIDTAASRIAAARRQALEDGHSVQLTIVRGGRPVAATAHTDGSVVADTSLLINRLSGRSVR